MDAARHASAHVVSGDGVTSLVRTPTDAKSMAAKLEHFRHEYQAIELPVFVESCEDFVLVAHLDEVSTPEKQGAAIVHAKFTQGTTPLSSPVLKNRCRLST